MKKLLFILLFCVVGKTAVAQTVITYIKEQLGTINMQFIAEDEAHDYAKLDVADTYTVEYRFWNTKRGKVAGTISASYTQPEELNKTTLLPNFQRLDGGEELPAMYEPHEVMMLFREKLASLNQRGDEVIWAEMQGESPNIKLYIVCKSDVTKNKGIPQNKIPIGELQYDDSASYFNLVSF